MFGWLFFVVVFSFVCLFFMCLFLFLCLLDFFSFFFVGGGEVLRNAFIKHYNQIKMKKMLKMENQTGKSLNGLLFFFGAKEKSNLIENKQCFKIVLKTKGTVTCR